MMEPLDRLKILAGITDGARDGLLTALLDDARDWMAEYTGRADWTNGVPDALEGLRVRIALNNYNRQGIEGMTQAQDGGMRRTIETIPEDVRRALNGWRLARIMPMTGVV
ncbi:MAG: phage head-tail connector protein [Oscillospiraceae bacterium]|jgi:hypothetical protein|nr:phage head-tail connector protein [Oscillospiraceae bacterium]